MAGYFSWLNNIPLHITSSLFIYPLTDTGRFHILAIVNNAAMNMGVQITLRHNGLVSLDIYPEVGLIAGSYGSCVF